LRSAFLALLSPSDVADLLEVPFKTLCFYLSKKKNYQQFLIDYIRFRAAKNGRP